MMSLMEFCGHGGADDDFPVMKGQNIRRGRVTGKALVKAGTLQGGDKGEPQPWWKLSGSCRRQAIDGPTNFSTEEPEVQPMTALAVAPMEGGFYFWHVDPGGNEFLGEEYFRGLWLMLGGHPSTLRR